MKRSNLYEVIGVASDASLEEIKATCEHRLQSDIGHNVKVVIRHARDTLCNPAMRAAYDSSLKSNPIDPWEQGTPAKSRHSGTPLAYLLLAGSIAIAVAMWSWNKQAKDVVRPAQPDQPIASIEAVHPRGSVTPAAATPATRPSGSVGIYAAAAPSVMLILSLGPNDLPIASGSGVVIAPRTVVTNCHVVVRTATVIVRNGNVDYPATSMTSDRQLDLCLLDVPNLLADQAAIGSVSDLHVGEPVYAIGAPHGLQRTLSQGIVSALQDSPDGPIIQSTAVIEPGSSGGGLFASDGRLVGITTARSKASTAINFAVPIDWLKKLESR